MVTKDRAHEAAHLLKKAEKLTQPSIISLRFKPDWEAAAPIFEKAANLYKQAKVLEKSQYAFEKAAQAHENNGSAWHAARHLQSAGDLAKQAGKMEETAQLYGSAAVLCLGAGRHEAGADAYSKGARAVEDQVPLLAAEMYNKALDILETEEKWAVSIDTFRSAVSLAIRRQDWDGAESLLLRQGHACEHAKATTSQCRTYVGSVVVALHCGEAAQAWAVYQDVMAIPIFASSEEATATTELMNAYISGSEDEIKQVVKKRPCFQYLDTAVGRLAVKLPTGDLQQMTKQLKAMGAEDADQDSRDDDNDDLT